MLSSRPAWRVCGEAASGRAAVAQAKRLKPALVILDVSMPELNGLEATRQILKATPKTQVLVFTMHDSEQVISAVLDAGARGFVVKSDGGKDLIAAVESMQQGKPYFNAKAADIVLKGYRGVRHRLSDREREVLQLLAEGRSNKEISTALGVSVKTVETHRANIMRKLELHSVTALVHYAMRNGTRATLLRTHDGPATVASIVGVNVHALASSSSCRRIPARISRHGSLES